MTVYSELPPQQTDTRHVSSSRAVRKLAEDQPKSTNSAALGYAHAVTKPHLDGITALTTFETPYSGALMIASGDRSGVIKVWRLDV